MIKKINLSKKVEERKDISKIESEILDASKHVSMINMILLDAEFDGKSTIVKNLKQKLNSYKTQDKKKDRFNEKTFITYDELVEKLVVSKLKCEYCKCKTLLMYANKREDKQWTLDRINNNLDHSNENTIISCLKCNLERRCKNDKKFKFTKQMRLIKKN